VHSENKSDLVEEQRRELESLRGELEQAHQQLLQLEHLAALGEMAAGMAHEIRNPLNFVTNFAALSEELLFELEEALAGQDDVSELVTDLKRNASVIVEHARRADNIVGALMRHAGSGAGIHERTDVNTFVDEFLRIAYRSHQLLSESLNCDIERHYAADVGEMLLNQHEMGRALLNILNNAFEAMESRANRQPDFEPRITVSTSVQGNDILIVIADNGGGVPKDIRERVFEPFFTTKKAEAGTGLGLSIAHDIVTGGHGGQIEMGTNEAGGASVIIRLPSHQESD
jgi:signal transduction histidine kinase